MTIEEKANRIIEDVRFINDAGRDIRFFNISSQPLMFESEFDVVTAVQSHHYLKPDERRVTGGILGRK